MKLPNFKELLPNKKKEQPIEYLLALQIGKTVSKAAIWQDSDGIAVKKITSADTPTKAIEEAASQFPSLAKIVFGLPANYVTDNKIKDSHLPELKRIAGDAHLKPIGFVVIPEAVAHYLEKETNTPQTCILLGVEDHALTFSLFRIGKCIKIIELPRTEQLFTDVEKGLASFDQEEILPSKLVLYNGSKNLDEVKEQLLSYPWQKNEKFLHVPKIEALPAEFSIQAIVFAGTNNNQEDAALNQPDTTVETATAATNAHQTDENEAETGIIDHDEETAEADTKDGLDINDSEFTKSPTLAPKPKESFGFTVSVDTPTAPPATNFTPRQPIYADSPKPKPALLGNMKLPQLSLPAHIPIPKMRAIIPVSAIILLVGGFFVYASYFYPQATVALIAEPNVIDNEITITLNTGISDVDITNKEIPGRVYTASISGDSSNATSGKKTIGEKATGEVLVYNKTSQSKTLAKGTVLGASSITFTLDSDVTVASASDSGESLTYGKERVKVTASKIGPNSNVKKDTEFTVGGESKSSVSAKNEADFGGGTEREVSVVSKDDQDKLIKMLTKNLEDEARQKLQEQVGGGEQFLDESLKSNVVDKKFDKNVGDETDNLALTLTLEFSQVGYNEEHLNKFFEEYMKEQISDQYAFDPEKSRFDVKKVEQSTDGKITFLANYHAYLLPKIDVSPFAEEFAGISKNKLEERVLGMKDQKIVGYDVTYQRQMPFFKSKLPMNPKNIEVKVIPY